MPRSSARRFSTLTDPELIELVEAGCARLPHEVATAVRPPATACGAAVVSRIPVTDAELGPTPRDWRAAARRTPRSAAFRHELAMLLLARCAGQPFGWLGQQDGRLVNTIVPAPGHEDEQSGAGSTTLLAPHTEDAFHPARAHLLLLGCLRNPDRVATTISSVREVRLSPVADRRLRTRVLPILPDVSYGNDFHRQPCPPVATVGPAGTLRYDPAYTPLDDGDAEFRSAYTELGAELERVCRTAILRPGQLLLLDNDVVVHGRVPFTPRYDGTDRWLLRVNIALPQRNRDPAERSETGYGQRTVTPFAHTPRPTPPSYR
ncbi:TauD/TfdA family dioxygenase [Nocardia stercoris]|nr:TauD/TfdA family dioxygenase [Nocardia stercoris]